MQNSVKTATDTPEIGRTVEKTTVTRVLPAESFPVERKTPDFWEYLERLTTKDWEKFPPHLHHKLYVYRRLGDTGSGIALERFENGVFPIPGRDSVPLNNQEEFEFAMAQKYGGGTYRLLLKKGSERITEGRILIDGAPKNTRPGILDAADSSNTAGATVTPSSDPSSDVAKTAMNIVASHEAEAVNIGLGMMRTAADVQRQMASQTGGQTGMDPVMQQFLQVAMQRLLQPPPDPLELMTRLATLFSSMGGNGAVNPTVTRIIDAGLERLMNPAPAAPGASTGAALVSALPQIASYATEALREWRAGSEVQLETARVMAASGRPPAALPPGPANGTGIVQPQAPLAGVKITQATQLQPPSVQGVQPSMPGVPSLEFIEQKIITILGKPINADEAADEVLSFLDLMEPKMIEQLASLSESQLIAIFQTRPVLRQYRDIPRLQEFVRAFLKYSNNQEPAPPDVDASIKPN